MSEHIVSQGVAFSRSEPCRIIRVIFHNPEATIQSLAFSNRGMPSTEARFSLFAPASNPVQYEMGGYKFPVGFTCTPSHANLSNIIIEYEDL